MQYQNYILRTYLGPTPFQSLSLLTTVNWGATSTIEAQEKILELREAAMQLQEENLALRQENKALKEALELRSKVIWEKPYYWVQSESGKDGPYCQHCYDGERK